jgi:hypothetical protein
MKGVLAADGRTDPQSPNFQKNNPACINRLACRVAGFLPSSCYILNREGITTTVEAPAKNPHRNAQSEPGAPLLDRPIHPKNGG